MNYKKLLDKIWEYHLQDKKDNPTVISTFAGCGGSSLGYSIAGYKELLAIEWDDQAIKTFELNFPNIPIYHDDIHKLSVKKCLSLANIQPKELDILDGSPPCQGFSTAGKRKLQDNRNQLYHQFIRLLRGLKPKAFIMENVSGLAKGKMKIIFADIMRELKSSGYQVRCKLLNAKYYLVPQNRQRLIWIGIRDDLKIKPSYPKGIKKIITTREAFYNIVNGETPPFNDKYARLWNKIKWGQNASHVIGTGFNNCHKIHPYKPSPTLPKMQTGRGFATIVHYNEKRALTIEEAKRLQSFPDQFQLSGNYQKKWAQIGNSVPPLFIYHIANHVKGLLGYDKMRMNEKFLNNKQGE